MIIELFGTDINEIRYELATWDLEVAIAPETSNRDRLRELSALRLGGLQQGASEGLVEA